MSIILFENASLEHAKSSPAANQREVHTPIAKPIQAFAREQQYRIYKWLLGFGSLLAAVLRNPGKAPAEQLPGSFERSLIACAPCL